MPAITNADETASARIPEAQNEPALISGFGASEDSDTVPCRGVDQPLEGLYPPLHASYAV